MMNFDNLRSLSDDDEDDFEKYNINEIKIIFLDIDGVLNIYNESHINKIHLTRLVNIINNTNSKIVLSTSWRNLIQKRRELWNEFEKVGILKEKVIVSNKYEMTPDLCPFQHRTDEIMITLDNIKKKFNVKSWLILDDMDLLNRGTKINRKRIINNFIRCNSKCGLTNKQMKEAIYKLNLD